MCKLCLIMFFIVGANCDCISPTTLEDFVTTLKNVGAELPADANTECVFVDTLQTNIAQKTEELIDQSLLSISEDYPKLKKRLGVLNKLQQLHVNFKDCSDVIPLEKKGITNFLPKYRKEVICSDDWIIIQQRKKVDNQVDFNRTWASYKEGFGELDTEFWIGNEFLHQITNDKSYALKVDMKDTAGRYYWVTYSTFKVGDEDSGYQLRLGESSGNIKDSLSYLTTRKFSTFDRDNGISRKHCAQEMGAGFWYNVHCTYAHLNGLFPGNIASRNFIRWDDHYETVYLIHVLMKISPN